MIHKVKYGNSVIQYKLIKSKRRKTSQITVAPDGVIVRTPQTKTNSDVKHMIQERLQWIFKKQLHFEKEKRIRSASKTTFPVLGRDYKIKIIHNSQEKTRLVGNNIEFHIPQKRHKKEQINAQYKKYLKNRARLLFPKLVDEYAKRVGKEPSKINIKQLKDRWGSSTSTGEINFNSNLMKAPKNVIKYVILHELCHFKIKEHSHHFWNLIGKHMPDYEESVRWLEVNGIRNN